MIDINLMPERFKKKKRSPLQFQALKLPREIIIGLIGGSVGLLVVIHLILLVVTIFQNMNFSRLNKEWSRLQPDKQEIDVLKREIKSIESKLTSLASLTGHKKISWAEKLNRISEDMERGLWLTKIYFSESSLKIEGSNVSKKGEEMINVTQFANNLKKDKDFSADVTDLEVNLIQRRNIKSIEVGDFIITVGLKE